MNPCELALLVTAVANSLYGCLRPEELGVLASVFVQLGDTLETLAAQGALLESQCNGESGVGK